MRAYRQKRRYVRLRSGAFLSGEALEQVAQAAQIVQGLGVTAEALGKGTDIPAARVLYMEDAIQEREGMSLTTSDAVAAWLRRLREARGVQAQAPSSLRAELRPYQRTGLSWLCALSHAGFGGILADDMGLGKTVQALALLLHEKEEGHAVRALVVCPASLQLNWKARGPAVCSFAFLQRADGARAGEGKGDPGRTGRADDHLLRSAQAGYMRL